MEMKEKDKYASPECNIHELRLEGIIASSADPQDYINPFNPYGGGNEVIW